MSKQSHFRSALIGALVGGLIAASLPVLAAAGGNFILGEGNSAGTQKTNLTSTAAGHTLRVKNQAGNAALKTIGDDDVLIIKVKDPGGVPIKISGDAGTATNLSADQVDGYDANSLIRVAGDVDTVVGTIGSGNVVVLSVDLTAPTAGFIVATASQSAQAQNPTVTSDKFGCSILLEGGLVDGSSMSAEIDTTSNTSEDCTTTAFMEVAAGEQTVAFQLSGVISTDIDLRGATLWAMFVPFDEIGDPSGL